MKKIFPAVCLSLALSVPLALPAAALEAEDARDLLQQYYVETLPDAVLQAETVEEMLALLGDPYTVYYTAEQYARFLSGVNGESLVGIGISISTTFDEGFELRSILPDSPALEAGMQVGDKVIAVDGVTLIAQDDPGSYIAGAEGTDVTVTVRTPAGEVRDYTLTRRTVHIPIVTYEQRGTMGLIVCDSFGDTTAEVVRQAVTELDADTAVWVMDLRSNPGGTGDAAAATAGMFLGAEDMVHFRDGQDVYFKTSTTAACPDLTDKPLIILTDGHSASAAELFSAAIRDHRGGIAVGQRTYGKGIAQRIFDENKYPELFDGDALKLTVYRFFSPEGTTNHLVGVLPTLLVAPEHTEAVAELLSAPKPERSLHHWKLEICKQTFYLEPEACLSAPEAFTELLEALPPDAALYTGTGSAYWREITPAQLAAAHGLDYQPRTFSDAQGHTYQREIDTLCTYGLLAGWDDGLFHPDEGLTRAQLCAIVANTMGLSSAEYSDAFSDVSPDSWYAGAVSAVAARGFMAGSGDGTFSPDAPVTRQELFTVLSAVAAWCSQEGYEWSKKDVSAVQWAEFYEYPEWAQAPARNLDKLGLDIPREEPGKAVTRGETAGYLCALLEQMNILWNK